MSLDNLAVPTACPPKHGTILVIDSDPLLPEELARHPSEADFQVLAAQNGMQGYWLALSEQPVAVVTELSMTNAGGVPMLECLKDNSHTEQIPVVVLADQDYPGMQHHLAGLGAAAVLPKPHAVAQVVSAIEQVLASQTVG